MVWFLPQLLYCQTKGHPVPTGREDGWAPQIVYMVVKTEFLSLPGIIYDMLYSTQCRASNNSFFRARSFKYISHQTCNKLYLKRDVILLWSVHTKDLFHQISTKHNSWAKFEVFTVKTMTITVFCDVPPCNEVDEYRFRGACCRNLPTLNPLHWWWRQQVSLEQWYLSTNYKVLYHKRQKSLSQLSS